MKSQRLAKIAQGGVRIAKTLIRNCQSVFEVDIFSIGGGEFLKQSEHFFIRSQCLLQIAQRGVRIAKTLIRNCQSVFEVDIFRVEVVKFLHQLCGLFKRRQFFAQIAQRCVVHFFYLNRPLQCRRQCKDTVRLHNCKLFCLFFFY